MSLATALAASLARMLAMPGLSLADQDSFADLLRDFGLNLDLRVADLPALQAVLPIADPVSALLDLVQRYEDGTLSAAAMAESALPLAQSLLDSLGALEKLNASDLAALPPPLDAQETWATVAAELSEFLLTQYLRTYLPFGYALLRLGGVISLEERTSPLPPTESLSWPRLRELLVEPPSRLATEYGWGAAFDFQRLMDAMGQVALALGVRARVEPVSDVLSGSLYGAILPDDSVQLRVPVFRGTTADGASLFILDLIVVPVASGTGQPVDSLLLTHVVVGNPGAAANLGAGWTLTVGGGAAVSGALGMVLTPDGPRAASAATDVGAAIGLSGTLDPPWYLLGDEEGTRLQVDGVTVELSLGGSAEALDLSLGFDLTEGLVLVIEPGDGDAFLAAVLGSVPLNIRGGFSLSWSARSGVTVSGLGGLDILIPLDRDAGPLHLESLRVVLELEDTGAAAEVTSTGSLVLGPIAATVQDLGIRAALVARAPGSPPGRFGSADLTLSLRPPTGLGISIDTDGIITGGGFLSLEAEIGRYTGIAQLQMLTVGLTVVGIVETKLPGKPDGWSLFLSVIADFTPVQLGLGFTLNGVGGFMGLHRTLDELALAEGVREGRLDSLLFPEDPIADAARILADIEAYFPTLTDHHAFGAMAKLGWGTPTLITAELGVVLALPDAEVAVVGELATVLPDPLAPLLELHMGVVGFIDVPEATFWVTASIYDSRLVGLALSGDMAMYLSLADAPYFLLSVGGFHPGWQAPPSVPSSLTALGRMAATIDLGDPLQIGVESYFAVTSNTLQFGAEAYAVAQARAVDIDFTAEGWFGFDVLLTRVPFALLADMSAGVTVQAEGETLAGIQLDLHLEGPKPWYGTGRAEFAFLLWDVPFQVEVGSPPASESPDSVDLWPLLGAAVADPASWVAPASATVLPEVSVRPLDPVLEPGLWMGPEDRVELRQQVLPLGREIDVYGALKPQGQTRFDVEAAGLSAGQESDWSPVQDWFASGQFTAMRTADRLSAPSFEQMDSGVSLSPPGAVVSTVVEDLAAVTLAYEEAVVTGRQLTHRQVRELPAGRLGLGVKRPRLPGLGPSARRSVEVPDFQLAPTRYEVVEPLQARAVRPSAGTPTTGPIRNGGWTFADAANLRSALDAGHPKPTGRRRVVPIHTVAAEPQALDLPTRLRSSGISGPGGIP